MHERPLSASVDVPGIPCRVWVSLSRAFRARGNLSAALACQRRALTLAPDDGALATELARLLEAHGDPEQAALVVRIHGGADAQRVALAPAPVDTPRLKQLAGAARAAHLQGDLEKALELHRQALRVAPDTAGIWLSAALLANQLGRQWLSLLCFEESSHLDPCLRPALEGARRVSVAAGLRDRAEHYATLAGAHGASPEVRLTRVLAVDAVQSSREAMLASRRTLERELEKLHAENLRITDIDAVSSGAYFLAYHGENDAQLQRAIAQLLLSALPEARITARHCEGGMRRPGRIRIGFISRFFYSHSIGATSRGLIERLSRDRFEVFVLRISPSPTDSVTESIEQSADHAVILDSDFRAARTQIAKLELDVLFYQDIGMEPCSYLLALSRLAPVQCVSFGHPDTTGIPTLDYFVSNDLYEPPGAQAHYTEQLFLLRELPTLAYYYRPRPPAAPAERTEFGLHPQDHVYLCPQALSKVHPDFDPMLAALLQADSKAVVVFLRGGYFQQADRLRQRLAATLGGLMVRVLFLDALPFMRFLQLMSLSDVCLDTPHFGGMNSSLEALSLGVPIVTLPGTMQRGRHTQAMYRKMGMIECIARDAQDYVAIAVRIGNDPQWARSLRARIAARCGILFEDQRVVTEFERFFTTAHAAANPDSRPP